MPTSVILDTDIGTDIDDCLALALLLGSPELKLEAVTCVYGDVTLRSRMVLKLLKLRGISDIPVYAGAREPIGSPRPIYWEGHEGQGLLDASDEAVQPSAGYAPDVLVERIMSAPGKIHLIAIGPLTNVALAFQKEPRIAKNLAHLTIMGGVARSIDRLDLPIAEHNIICDPDAAKIVFASGAPITLVPLDITTQVEVDEDGLKRIQAVNTPFHAAVADQLARYPRFQRYGRTSLHDPLAIGVVADRSFVKLQPVTMLVEGKDDPAPGVTLMRQPQADEQTTIKLAVSVDKPRFEAFFVDRVAGQ